MKCIDWIDSNISDREAKVLDFGAGRGHLGQLLTRRGFTEVYGQEGSEAKKQMLLKQGTYRDIEATIVGKQPLPRAYRKNFDVVVCASLGTNTLPARCFEDMLSALKPGGYLVFTVGTKHLSNDPFDLQYAQMIEKFESRGAISPVVIEEFDKFLGVHKEQFSFLVFEKA